MRNHVSKEADYTSKLKDIGIAIADHVDAMLAYWDKNLVCRFANKAYWQWFGKKPEEMINKITIQELLGPLYSKNLPYIEGVLKGNPQTFEREIPTPAGEIRYSLANYYPDIDGEEVAGFFVHVADVSQIKKLEIEQEKLVAKLQSALLEVKTLAGLLPICAWCKNVRDDNGYWQQIEKYFSEHTGLTFTHSICNTCLSNISANST